jgi:hypothetical protein
MTMEPQITADAISRELPSHAYKQAGSGGLVTTRKWSTYKGIWTLVRTTSIRVTNEVGSVDLTIPLDTKYWSQFKRLLVVLGALSEVEVEK